MSSAAAAADTIEIDLQLDLIGLHYSHPYKKLKLLMTESQLYSVEQLMDAAQKTHLSDGVPEGDHFFQYDKNLPLLPNGNKSGLSELIASYRYEVTSKTNKIYPKGDYRFRDQPFFFSDKVVPNANGIAVWQYYLQELVTKDGENYIKELSKTTKTGTQFDRFTSFEEEKYPLKDGASYRLIWRSVNIFTAPKTDVVFRAVDKLKEAKLQGKPR